MKKFYLILTVLIFALIFSACGTNQPAPTNTPEPTAVPTEAPTEAPTEEPTEVPTEVPTEEPTTEPAVEEPVVEASTEETSTAEVTAEEVAAVEAAVEQAVAENPEAVAEVVAEAAVAEAVAETVAEAAVEEAVADAVVDAAVAEAVVEDAVEEAAADAVVDEAVAQELGNPLPDWTGYDAFIKEIKSTTDFAERAKMMHMAEDMLMETGAILPIYYYNDLYMQSEKVDGIYSSLFATKYFYYATKEGDDKTLRINLSSEPDHLDPALNSSVDGACLAANSFSGLYAYNADGELAPQLAEGYTVSEDGLTYTFTLKEDLKWSDGSDLTADDFVYSWKRAADPKTAADYSYMFDVIAGWDEWQEGKDEMKVSAPDARTIVVTLKSPCAYMLDLVAFPTYFPVKQSVVEAAADWETNPGSWAQEAGFVSNGAYTLESWNHDESMVYVKNPYWYDADKVSIERIEYMLSADDTAIYAAYRAGDLDFADTVPTDEIQTLIDTEDPEFHIVDELGTYYVIFNVKNPLFAGKSVAQANAMRQAFSKLVDRQYIIDTVGQTGQKIATSFLPAGMADGNGGVFKDAKAWDYPVEDGYYGTEVDVDGARELLKFAGYKFDEDGMLSEETPISFEYLTNATSGHVAIAECIQQDLAEVGIEMTIRSIDWNVFLNERKDGNYDIARNGWIADFNDPINMLEMWTTNSGNNDAQFGRYEVSGDAAVLAVETVAEAVEEEAVEEAVTDAVVEGAVAGAAVEAVTDDALAGAVVADAVAEESLEDAVVEAAVEEAVVEAAYSPLPDWEKYDQLIKDIKTTTDFEKRAEMLHQAEDMLMETGAILPIYYYNDLYMQSEKVDGIYSSVFGTKYFMYATKEGDNTLKINLSSEPDHLDPALNSSVDGACLAANSFSGLYTYNEDGELAPELAEGYTVSEDGLTYTFTLKDGLKWSDGSELTANDFVYAWKRAADPLTAADYSYMFDVIAGYDKVQEGEDALEVSAPDAKTLVVTLNSPCAYMLDLMAFPTFFPVKQSVVEAAKDWQTNPGSWAQEAGFVSNGAYTLESWNHDESMVYVKNPNWYNADKVTIERIEYMLSADDTAIFAAYRAGDLDFADTVPTDEIANLKDIDPEFHIIDNLGTYYVIFNVKSPLFFGKTVEQANAMRKAFSMLIDREYIIDTVAQCEQEVATSFIPAGMADGNGGIFKDALSWDYPVDDGYYDTDVDVDGARELLEFAGFKFNDDGMLSEETPLSFEYLTNTNSGHQAIAECIQQDLAEVGINMSIRSIDWNVFLNERKDGNYDIARNGWLADFNDPINMLEMWTTDSGNNDAQFGRY